MASPVYGYDVDSESLLDEETAKVQPAAGQRGPSISVSPSPFHVPVGVEIIASSDDACLIRFAYPNEERPERSWHIVEDDPALRVQHGKYTGKVLAVRLSSALERLRNGPLLLNPNAVGIWCSTSPESTQGIGRRSASIVARLLLTMPDEIRQEVVQSLQELTRVSHDG